MLNTSGGVIYRYEYSCNFKSVPNSEHGSKGPIKYALSVGLICAIYAQRLLDLGKPYDCLFWYFLSRGWHHLPLVRPSKGRTMADEEAQWTARQEKTGDADGQRHMSQHFSIFPPTRP